MNILVCEDDEGIRELIKIIIQDMGYNVFVCSDKAEFTEIINHNKVNLIVLDYWLSKIKADGIVAETKSKYKDLPIILVSAVHNLDEVSQKLKVDGYIEKPFDIEELKSKIKSLI